MTASSVNSKRFNSTTSFNAAVAGHSPITFSQLDKLTASIVNITSSSSLLPPSPSRYSGLRLLHELFELSVPTDKKTQEDQVSPLDNQKENEHQKIQERKELKSSIESFTSEVILRKHGFPTRDRLATSFAAAQRHSTEGALLQLFTEGIARLFSDETCELINEKQENTPAELRRRRENVAEMVELKSESRHKTSNMYETKEQMQKTLEEQKKELWEEQHSREYESNYITRMFNNLQSTAGFASEWEQTLKECVRANSSLQAHLYELQGFGVLYSYIWSQTAMLVALMHKMEDSDDITTVIKQQQRKEFVANKCALESDSYNNRLNCTETDTCNTFPDFADKTSSKGNNLITATTNNSHDPLFTNAKLQEQQEEKNELCDTGKNKSDNKNTKNGQVMEHRLPLKLNLTSLPVTTTVHVQSLASPETPVSGNKFNQTNYNTWVNNNTNKNNSQTNLSEVLENYNPSEKREQGKLFTPRLAVHSHALGELTKMKRKYAQLSGSSFSSSLPLPLTLPVHGLQPNINNCVDNEEITMSTTENNHNSSRNNNNNNTSNNGQENAKRETEVSRPTLMNRWVPTLPFVRDKNRNNSNNDSKQNFDNWEQAHDMRTGNSTQAQEIKTYMSQLRAMMDEQLKEKVKD